MLCNDCFPVRQGVYTLSELYHTCIHAANVCEVRLKSNKLFIIERGFNARFSAH
jgi:hypothetical protein